MPVQAWVWRNRVPFSMVGEAARFKSCLMAQGCQVPTLLSWVSRSCAGVASWSQMPLGHTGVFFISVPLATCRGLVSGGGHSYGRLQERAQACSLSPAPSAPNWVAAGQ